MSEEQLVGTLIKIESNRKVEFIPSEYSRHVIDSDGLAVYAEPKSKLTIPKSIADWLDKAFKEYENEQHMASTILSCFLIKNVTKNKNIEKWFNDFDIKRLDLATAYLAGKSLGVDLVKVVEG